MHDVTEAETRDFFFLNERHNLEIEVMLTSSKMRIKMQSFDLATWN